MPYRAYTPNEKTEALAILQEHPGDLASARAELIRRWGYAPSLPTLCTWLLSGQNVYSKGITPPTPETCQDQALKGLEGRTTTAWGKLIEAIRQLAEDPAFVVIVIGKR